MDAVWILSESESESESESNFGGLDLDSDSDSDLDSDGYERLIRSSAAGAAEGIHREADFTRGDVVVGEQRLV